MKTDDTKGTYVVDQEIEDAMEMLGKGYEPRREIATEISGFVPVFEVVMKQYKDHVTALVFGRMWQYCGMEDGVCRASLKRIGDDLEVDKATVSRHSEKLVKDGYLIDTTPDRRNRPHVYKDAGKVIMKSSVLGVAQNNSGVAQNNSGVALRNVGVAESRLIKQDNTTIIQKQLSKPQIQEIEAEANKKVDAILGMEKQKSPILEATKTFESLFGFGSLNWDSKPEWRKFALWITEIHKSDLGAMKDYVSWRLGDGKYQAMSNNKIRQNPQMFMDTGWPTFLAHTSMYGKEDAPESPSFKRFVPQDESKFVPAPERLKL